MLSLIKTFWPILIIPLIIGFVRIWITNGIKYAIRIITGILIAIAAIAIVIMIII